MGPDDFGDECFELLRAITCKLSVLVETLLTAFSEMIGTTQQFFQKSVLKAVIVFKDQICFVDAAIRPKPPYYVMFVIRPIIVCL